MFQPGDMAMLQAHSRMLRTRWDTVQIIVTRNKDGEGTRRLQHVLGNVYARIESCAEWVREVRKE
jgi:hypothetical protein